MGYFEKKSEKEDAKCNVFVESYFLNGSNVAIIQNHIECNP